MPDLTGRTLGCYRLGAPVGQGGMATVYLAHRLTDGRRVAVKVLSPQIAENEAFLHRFRREAKVLMRLSHPNIVPIEAFDEVDGLAFLAMPFLELGSLADCLQRSRLDPGKGGRIIDHVSAALHHAHGMDIVHRDVKPSNILLGPDGQALLSDFGLAQVHDATLSLTGSAVLGTPSYASPEQVRGETITPLSDQYSLGIVLFEMTTGRLPFEAETPLALLLKHASEPTPPPRSVNANIPEVIERVILRATAKRPEDRFPSVLEMNVAFQAALAYALDPHSHRAPTILLPAVERQTKIRGRAEKKKRRRTLLAAALVPLALLMCAGAFLTGLLGAPKSPSEAAQLTALAGTIQALSTQLVADVGAAMSPEDVEAAVVATLDAGGGTSEPAIPARLPGQESQSSPTATPGGGAGLLAIVTIPMSFTPTASRTLPPSATPETPFGPSATTPPTGAPPTAPPTHTPPATSTATTTASPTSPVPSSTPAPATAVPLPCDVTYPVGFSRSGSRFTVLLRNQGPIAYMITSMSMSWPGRNDELKRIRLEGVEIWEGEVSSPRTITNWKSGADRRIYPGGDRALELTFDEDAAASGYSISITLEATCSLDASS
ncbi:MAG TPA: serine/threonine-protein kinase [Anaerolineales bacterium]|nr:serine/threonine-protein kinase [Anaerolineales bacterium]